MAEMSLGIVFLASLLAVLGFGARAIVGLSRRAMRGDVQVRFGEMLQRQGIAAADIDAGSTPFDSAHAIRNCALCGKVPECRAWLDAGERSGHQKFCPNAGYFARLKQPQQACALRAAGTGS
jgi:hypothetical protein